MGRKKQPIEHDVAVQRFARALREVRQRRGLTQVALAERIGSTEQYVSRLEKAKVAPGIDLVSRLAVALGATLHDLLPLGDPPDERATLLAEAQRLFDSVTASASDSSLDLLIQFLAMMESARTGDTSK